MEGWWPSISNFYLHTLRHIGCRTAEGANMEEPLLNVNLLNGLTTPYLDPEVIADGLQASSPTTLRNACRRVAVWSWDANTLLQLGQCWASIQDNHICSHIRVFLKYFLLSRFITLKMHMHIVCRMCTLFTKRRRQEQCDMVSEWFLTIARMGQQTYKMLEPRWWR